MDVRALAEHNLRWRSRDGGDAVLCVPWDRQYTQPSELRPPDRRLDLLHEDDHILVLDKPAYLPVENTRYIKDSLISRCRAHYPPVHHVAHRLDWETSGLLVVARTAEAHRSLQRQFERRQVCKRYVADLISPPPLRTGELSLPIAPDRQSPPLQCVDLSGGGKAATTRWRSLGGCRVELEPTTGRRHQLRLHMLALGCPIHGDSLYSEGREGDTCRLHLHSTFLAFSHPEGHRVEYESPPPFEPP